MKSNVTAIVLAAGRSSRMEDANKLLLPFRGKTLLEHTVDAVCAAAPAEVVVVTGHQDRQIRDVLYACDVRVAYNPEYAAGIATSIRRGVLAAAPGAAGYMICLGDMPLVRAATLQRLQAVFSAQDGPSIVVAAAGGRQGHPVLFDRTFREALLHLEGDHGARAVLDAHPDTVVLVEVEDGGIFQDIDTREAYDQLQP